LRPVDFDLSLSRGGLALLYIKTWKGPSNLAREGLFAREDVGKGGIVANFVEDAVVLTEKEYQLEQKNGNELVIMSGVRWIGGYFLCKKKIGHEEYINHSFGPNLIYHMGVCFAARRIRSGEELTADYRFFLAENDVNAFTDVTTGRRVDGFSAEEALYRSARAVVAIMESSESSSAGIMIP